MKKFIPIVTTIAALALSAADPLCGADTSSPGATDYEKAMQQAKDLAQEAQRMAARQLEEVRQQVAESDFGELKRQLAQTLSEVDAAAGVSEPPRYGGGGFGGAGGFGRGAPDRSRRTGAAGKVLVIRSTDADPGAQGNLEEDLTVMSRVFDKSIDDLGAVNRRSTAMGIDLFFSPSSNPNRTLYLDGYGALFLLRVNFPLLAPPAVKEEEPKEKPATDSTWEEAKRELYGQSKEGRVAVAPGEEYDAGKVGKLKDALLEALKSGTNIRGLKADDSITICVFGGAGALSGGKRNGTVKIVPMNEPIEVTGDAVVSAAVVSADDRTRQLVVSSRGESGLGRATVITIRAKKSDVDAFAKGKLNLDEFRKKVSIVAYFGNPEAKNSTAPFFNNLGSSSTPF